ncbi:MAG TPA: stressosome-associated protein Prli42 [Cerasibacillus sp.]
MSTKPQKSYTRKPSKRERRMKIIVYLMILAMILSTVTIGLASIL